MLHICFDMIQQKPDEVPLWDMTCLNIVSMKIGDASPESLIIICGAGISTSSGIAVSNVDFGQVGWNFQRCFQRTSDPLKASTWNATPAKCLTYSALHPQWSSRSISSFSPNYELSVWRQLHQRAMPSLLDARAKECCINASHRISTVWSSKLGCHMMLLYSFMAPLRM